MDVWIRSQDKKRLIPNPNLYVIWNKEISVAYIGDTIVGHIAKYKTEKRALEVLDEIQSRLIGRNLIKLKANLSPFSKNCLKKEFRTNAIVETPLYEIVNSTNIIIYEMPKE